MYDKLFSLCAFSAEDLERERPRIQKAFDRVGLSEEDIQRGVERIETFYDTRLEGVRRLLGVWMKEFICVVLADEERQKIIYSTVPSIGGNPAAVANVISKDFYAGFPDIVLLAVMGGIFGKIDGFLEEAEKHALPSGHAHCGVNQLRLGRYLLDAVPKPDLHISWAVFCDEAPKVDDIISEYFQIPTIVVNRCQDGWTVRDGLPQVPERSINYAAEEIKRVVDRMGETLGITITDDMLMGSVLKLFELYDFWVEIGLLLKTDPIPISQVDLNLLHWATVICFQDYDELIKACSILLEETKERVNKGIGVLEKGAPKVFFAGVSSISDPSLVKMLEDLGVGVNSTEYQVFGPEGGPRLNLGDVGELAKLGPYQIIARIFSKNNVFGGLAPQIETLKKAFRYWMVDGVLWYLQTNCRTYSTSALMIKDAIRKETPDLPFMILEGDVYDPRSYSTEQLRVRLETFADMVQIKKKTKLEQFKHSLV